MTEEDFKVQVESVLVQVGEKDFNLKMENKRFWEEIGTFHTNMFDRQDREVATLKDLTLEEFRSHFTKLFFDPTGSKRLDLELTSLKHAES